MFSLFCDVFVQQRVQHMRVVLVSSRSKDASEAVSSAFAALLYEPWQPRATALACLEREYLRLLRAVETSDVHRISSVCV